MGKIMSRILQRFLFVAAFGLFASSAMAVVPADGIWWNPNESGRGYTIENQNGLLVVTAYTYDQDRTSTFFQAAGPFNELGTVFNGELAKSTGGQCFGCTYQSPTRTDAGPITINFSSAESGVITYPGGSSAIVHYAFGFGGNQQNYLYGEWSFEYQILGTVFAQWVIFDSTYAGSDGTLYISGFEDS
jgi:hypothetical protein